MTILQGNPLGDVTPDSAKGVVVSVLSCYCLCLGHHGVHACCCHLEMELTHYAC